MVFRKVPAGTYTIGDKNYPTNDACMYGRYNGSHTVKIPADYYIAIFRLTQGQYARITGDTTVATRANKYQATVTWNTMRGSAGISAKPSSGPVATMASKTNLKIDLPTHAMFEVAARAGSTASYASGTSLATIKNYIWCNQNTTTTDHDVGSLLPNAWGLYDVQGLDYGPVCRDCTPRAAGANSTATPNLVSVETAAANGFVTISSGDTSYRMTGTYMNLATPTNNSRYMLAQTYFVVPSATISQRLAVYPAAYYPNGGK